MSERHQGRYFLGALGAFDSALDKLKHWQGFQAENGWRGPWILGFKKKYQWSVPDYFFRTLAILQDLTPSV